MQHMKMLPVIALAMLACTAAGCKKATNTSTVHVRMGVGYAPPNTSSLTYTLSSDITVTLIDAQNQVVATATLTAPGVADLGTHPDGSYTCHSAAVEMVTDRSGNHTYRNTSDECNVMSPEGPVCYVSMP